MEPMRFSLIKIISFYFFLNEKKERKNIVETYFRFFEKDGKIVFEPTTSNSSKEESCYADVLEDTVEDYGLIAQFEEIILKQISGLQFGEALEELMSPRFFNCSQRELKSKTGLDSTTLRKMKDGKALNRRNVVSLCLGLNLPFAISIHLLRMTGCSIDPVAPGRNNKIYFQLLATQWYKDYDDLYTELKRQGFADLLKQPPVWDEVDD